MTRQCAQKYHMEDKPKTEGLKNINDLQIVKKYVYIAYIQCVQCMQRVQILGGGSISNCEEILSALNTSKHLKGQLDSPVCDKKSM